MEASIFYPIGILAIIATIYISIEMTKGSFTSASLHINVISEALIRAEKGEVVYYSNLKKNSLFRYKSPTNVKVESRETYKGIQKIIRSNDTSKHSLGGIFKGKKEIKHKVEKYIIDEKQYIRVVDTAGEIIFEDD